MFRSNIPAFLRPDLNLENFLNVPVKDRRQVGCRKFISEEVGNGYVSARCIPKGEILFEYNGSLVSRDEADARQVVYESKGWPYAFFDVPSGVIDPYDPWGYDLAPWVLLNHSAVQPNVEAKLIRRGQAYHVLLISKFWIPKGFELRWTYRLA